MRVLITGATGLFGSHLLHRLALDAETRNLEVMGLKRPSSDLNKVKDVFSYYKDEKDLFGRIQWQDGDILDRDSLVDATKEIDLVYHCAAIVSFDPKDRDQLIQNNIDGTQNLLFALGYHFNPPGRRVTVPRDPSPTRLIHISSTSALGDAPGNDPDFLIDETTPRDPNRRHSGYSVSKYESEKLVWQAIDQGLNAIIFNPGIILGPGFWNKGSSKLFTQMQQGLKFYTNGGTGYVDIRDLVEIIIPHSPFPIPHSRYCIIGFNQYYKTFFNKVADELGVKRPSIKAGKFLSGLAWRLDTLKARIKNTYPLITRETAESANRISFYSNQKVMETFDFEFRTMEETVEWICGILKQG